MINSASLNAFSFSHICSFSSSCSCSYLPIGKHCPKNKRWKRFKGNWLTLVLATFLTKSD